MLYDSKSIFQDQYDAIEEVSKRRGEEGVNFALLTDGLKAEREQGITIDVAYRYFSTPSVNLLLLIHRDISSIRVTGNRCQYCECRADLIDARQGVLEQTRRHAIISSLLQIPHLVICINKMDLVDYSQEVYDRIHDKFEDFAGKLDVHDVSFIPISALRGDNVVDRSANMPWYQGATLLYYLESVHIASDYNFIDCRFPVQHVIRPYSDAYHDYRGYAGRIAGGIFKKGDDVMLLPSGFTTKISKIETYDGELEEAFPPMSVTMHIEDDFDISRGDMIVRVNNVPRQEQEVDLMICWFNEKPLQERGKYILRHTTKEARCIIREVRYRMDVNTLHRDTTSNQINMNDIARISIRSTLPLFVDPYHKNRITGSVILIDEGRMRR